MNSFFGRGIPPRSSAFYIWVFDLLFAGRGDIFGDSS